MNEKEKCEFFVHLRDRVYDSKVQLMSVQSGMDREVWSITDLKIVGKHHEKLREIRNDLDAIEKFFHNRVQNLK